MQWNEQQQQQKKVIYEPTKSLVSDENELGKLLCSRSSHYAKQHNTIYTLQALTFTQTFL
jgi:hypothetical protein